MFRRYPGPLVRRGLLIFAATVLLSAAMRAAQAALPSAREIIDRYLAASGGSKAMLAIKTVRAHGTLAIPSQQMSGSFEMIAMRPNKAIMRATIGGIGQIEEGFDGKVGWSIDPLSGPSLVTGKALGERADESWFDAALHAPDFVRQMTVVGRETMDGRQAYHVKVVLLSGVEQSEYFDVENGLQIAMVATRETPLGPMPSTTMFREYRKFGALTLPVTHVQRVLGAEQVVTLAGYEFDTVQATAFDLPAVIKALIK